MNLKKKKSALAVIGAISKPITSGTKTVEIDHEFADIDAGITADVTDGKVYFQITNIAHWFFLDKPDIITLANMVNVSPSDLKSK